MIIFPFSNGCLFSALAREQMQSSIQESWLLDCLVSSVNLLDILFLFPKLAPEHRIADYQP